MKKGVAAKFVILVLALSGLAAGYWIISQTGLLSEIGDQESLGQFVGTLGGWGPAAVVGFMMVAIVFSPLPSAPIALTAGALYGHTWGTIYVVAGAEAGAVAAFIIARICGRDLVERWVRGRLPETLLGNQNGLMWLVFVSRLLPFVSFDLVSYAAGLTALSFWRFALATMAGIVPASFLLAHFGGEMAEFETVSATAIVVLLGSVTAVPLLYQTLRRR